MKYTYTITSPSLEGLLSHESLAYEGVRRPVNLVRFLDGPAIRTQHIEKNEQDQKALEQYLHDLQGIFMKKFSSFVVASEPTRAETLTLQAMLQELIKIKELMPRMRQEQVIQQ